VIIQTTLDGEPAEALLLQIAAILQRSGIAILPTETIYGLHAAADDARAVQKIDKLKNRDSEKPFVVLCSTILQAKTLGIIFHEKHERKLEQIWPAPLTVLLPISRPIAAAKNHEVIAVRISALPWLRRLCEIAGPTASSSVNHSGENAITSTKEISKEILTGIDAIIDAGPIVGLPSTIVDLTTSTPNVVREGAFSFSQNLWKRL